MANCPVCETVTLKHATLGGNLPAYSCFQCGGVLLSLVVYRHWREDAMPAPAPNQEYSPVAASKSPDTSAALTCPRCRSVMAKYRIAAAPNNRLDYCSHCEDVWLDGGEWELVESLAASGELTRIFTQPWQRRIRTDISEHMQSERLQKLLGGDYEKFTEFREWLEQHPRRDDLVAQLTRGRK